MKRILLAIGMIVLMVSSYPAAMKYSQSFKFVDEDEHIVIGWLMTKGKHLYADVSTNHQPLNYVFSAVVHRISHPDNLYMLITRHRQIVFLWGAIWAVLLVWRFGWKALLPVMIYEVSKYWLLGNEFLAESFAAYPTAYIFGSAWEFCRHQKRYAEELFLGIAFALAVFFSIPLVIPLGILLLLRLIKQSTVRRWLQTIGGFLIVSIPLFVIVPVKDYVIETIYYNGRYGIPLLAQFKSVSDVVRLWMLPFGAWWSLTNPLDILWASMGVVWLISLIYYAIRRQYRRVGMVLFFFWIWGLTNFRVIELHQYYFSGFHLLPWLLTGLLLAAYLICDMFHTFSKRVQLIAGIVLVGWSCWWWTQPTLPWRRLPDPATESYIQYTPDTQVSQIINALKNPNDLLMVFPNESLLHWNTGLLPPVRQVTFYEWQYQHPVLRQQLQTILTTNPPRFIQYTNDYSSYASLVEQTLSMSYIKVFDRPALYIRKDSLATLTDDQREAFRQLPSDFTGLNQDIIKEKQ